MDFKEIYSRQKQFQELVGQNNTRSKEEFLKELILHLNDEAFEVLREINWKIHKLKSKNIDQKKLLIEMVDVIKYALSLPASWNFSAEEVEQAFIEKTEIVEQKFRQEMINKNFSDNDKVVGIDIDGVLLNYPETFLEFAAKELDVEKDITKFVLHNYRIYEELSEFFDVPIEKIQQIKHKFRIGGYKKNIKPIAGSAQFVSVLRNRGYKIILLSARPVQQYENIFYDTIISLKNAEIIFDGIYFSEEKEKEILEKFSNIEFFIEDSKENAFKIAKGNKKVFLLDKSYNQFTSEEKKQELSLIIRINTLYEIFNHMETK